MTPTPPEVVPAQVGGVVATQADISAAKPIIIRVMIDELTAQDLHEAFARHRLATIEECAKVCDGNRTDDDSMWDRASAECASLIRQLSAPPPPPVDVGEGEDG